MDEVIEEMYEQISKISEMVKKDILIILGNWNTIAGEESERDVIGKFGLGKRNKRGE